MLHRFPHLRLFALTATLVTLSTAAAMAQRADHPDDSLYGQNWGVSVKAVGAALPVYSMADGPTKIRDYLVKNTSTHSETITSVASECDCVTPSIPPVGIDGKPQHLPCILGIGDSILVRVAIHLDHLEPGILEKTIEILGDGAAPSGVIGAFYARARIMSPISVKVTPGTVDSQPPWPIDAGTIPLTVGKSPHRKHRFEITVTADNRLLSPVDPRKSLALVSDDPLLEITRVSSKRAQEFRFEVAVENDRPRPSFSVRLSVLPRTTLRNAALSAWLRSSRLALRGSDFIVTGSVIGSVRATPEAVTLGLYPRTGQPQTDRLDPLDPAGADVELQSSHLEGLRIEADSRLVSVKLTQSTLRVQAAPYLIRTYRAGGEIPRKARLASTLPSTIGDPVTGQASMLYTNVRIFSGDEPPLVIPVTIMIEPFQPLR